jgi:hypothetical protein
MIDDCFKLEGFKTHAEASDEAKRKFYRAVGVAAVAAALDVDWSPEEAAPVSAAHHIPAFLVRQDLAA